MGVEAASDRVLPGGLLGYLEDFEFQETGSERTLILRGWILGNSSVRSVILKHNGTPLSVPYGLVRPDVADAYPDNPHAARAGFGGFIYLPRARPRRATVEICAI